MSFCQSEDVASLSPASMISARLSAHIAQETVPNSGDITAAQASISRPVVLRTVSVAVLIHSIVAPMSAEPMRRLRVNRYMVSPSG